MSTAQPDSRTAVQAEAAPVWWKNPLLWLWACLALSAALVLTVGALTTPSIGDELVHYSVAQKIHETGQRPIYHDLLQRSEVTRKPVRVDVLWHFGLAGLWYATGGIRQFTAQFYNACYLVLLTAGTYLVCRKGYDRSTSALAAIVACTVPMSVGLSIPFHDDVAVGALSTLAFLAVVQKRYALTGLALGLATLLKRTTYLILPGLFVLMLLPDKESFVAFLKHPLRFLKANFWAKLRGGLVMGLLALAVMAPDMNFRVRNFGAASLVSGYRPEPQFKKGAGEGRISSYDVSSPISNPSSLVTYPGPALLAGLGLYLLKRKDKARDYAVLLLAGVGLVMFLVLGNKSKFILRYLLVLVPVLAILAALGVRATKSAALRGLIIAGCFAQMLGVCAFVYKNRRLSPGFLEACAYLRDKTPEDTKVLGVPATVITFYSQRSTLWGYADVRSLLWSRETRLREIADTYNIDYLVMDRSRVYDDAKARHLGGWPNSFVRKVKDWQSLQEVFHKGKLVIWKINRDAPIPPAATTAAAATPASAADPEAGTSALGTSPARRP